MSSPPLQLDPPLYLETPLGLGWAHIYTPGIVGADTFWTVFLDNGAVVIFRNDQVRAANCYSGGRWNPGQGKRLRARGTKADKDMARLTRPR